MTTNAQLFDGDKLVGQGQCSLPNVSKPETGSMLVLGGGDFLRFDQLTLNLSTGQTYRIMPTQFQPNNLGGLLTFDILKAEQP